MTGSALQLHIGIDADLVTWLIYASDLGHGGPTPAHICYRDPGMIPQPFTTAARTRTLLFLLRFNKKSLLRRAEGWHGTTTFQVQKCGRETLVGGQFCMSVLRFERPDQEMLCGSMWRLTGGIDCATQNSHETYKS